MLNGIDVSLGIIGAGLEIALAITLFVRGFWLKEFPFFFSYICYAVLDVVTLLVIEHVATGRTYARVFWVAQAIYAVFGLLAMNEAFRKVFKVYYLRRGWFSWLVPGLVLVIGSISVWKWLRHAPVQAGPLTVAYISFDLATNYMLAGVFGLFGLLVFFWRTKWQQYTFDVMLGFGVFSIVGMLADALRSDFGTRMNFFFIYAASVAYIVACVIWLLAFMQPRQTSARHTFAVDLKELLELLDRLKTMLNKAKDAKG